MAKKHSNPDWNREPTKAEVLRAREFLAGPRGPGNYKSVDVMVAEIIDALRECESVALTALGALKAENTRETNWAATTLRVGCVDGLTDQIARLEGVVESAKAPHAPRLIIEDLRPSMRVQ